jgi:subfamily B ATP-binding cassette protein MsbA
MSPKDTPDPTLRRSLMKRVFVRYLLPQKLRLIFAIVCALGVAVMSALSAWWLDPAVELLFNPLGQKAKALPALLGEHPLLYVPLVLIVLSAFRFVFQRGLVTTINRVGHQLVGRVQSELFNNMVHADLGQLMKAHSGSYLSSVLYDAGLLREAATAGVINYVQHSMIVLSALVVMARMDLPMTLLVMLAGPVISLVLSGYIKRTKAAAVGAMAETSSLSTAIMESLDGIRIIKISNQENYEQARVDAVIERRQNHIIKGANARAVAAPATEALTGVLTALVIAYAGFRAQSGGMGLGGFMAFLASLIMAGQSLRQLANLQTVIQEGVTAAQRLFAALDIRPEITDGAGNAPLKADFETIRFNHCAFGYEAQRPVLKNINFEVTRGQSVALVGPSGAGKSTLLNLIARFFDLSAGEITFDGVPHSHFSLRGLRAHIALVTQDPFLFDDTIRANVAYGNGDCDDAVVWQALKDAAAEDFVRALPDGLDTRVGEAGARLSGGQKQRIAIARAFLKNAPLLLLDEATSALDTQSEIKVQEALERLMRGRTTFIIAHRLSTIRHADMILVLKDGEIVERGHHETLMKAHGLYAQLAGAQDLGTVSSHA